MAKRNFQIYRGTKESGELAYYETDVSEGMVVLDVIHKIQAEQANDLALRWNCKAGNADPAAWRSTESQSCPA